MLRPEYLYYYMTGVYSDKSSPIFQGCKDNAFVSHGKHLRGEVGMWGKMMMRKDVSKRYMLYYVMQKCVAGFSMVVVCVLSTVCC